MDRKSRSLFRLPLVFALIALAVHTFCTTSTYVTVSRERAVATTDLTGLMWMPLQLLDLPATFVGPAVLEFIGFRSRQFDDDFYTWTLLSIFGGIQWFLIVFVAGSMIRAVYLFAAGTPRRAPKTGLPRDTFSVKQ